KRLRPLAAVLSLAFSTAPLPGAFEPAPSGRGGAIASNDARATAIGLEILKGGGNAVDAAVATALALAVVFPEAGNLGGGGFAVIKKGDELRALDFRETAPAAATRGMYLDEHGAPRPSASTVGPLATGVPGSPAGLWELHHRFGALPWARIVAPAERLAREGFAVDSHLHAKLGELKNRAGVARFAETSARWLTRDGTPLPVGTVVRSEALAATLAAYRDRGPEGIVSGPAAAAVEAAAKKYGGVLTASDLAAYRPVWREPIRFEAFGWRFATMPLPSSGGLILGETFGQLERLGWPQMPRFGAERAHLLVEAFRRAFADRYLLGDPASTRADVSELLAPAWLDRLAASIDRTKASDSRRIAAWPGDAPPAE